MTYQGQLDLFPWWFWLMLFGVLFILVVFVFVMIVKAAQDFFPDEKEVGSDNN